MAKFSGKVGYIELKETSPGVWTEEVTERQYYGDLVRHGRRWASTDGVNERITFNQDISIVADPYLYDHMHNMRYVIFQNIKWEITNIEIERPRVRITTGEEDHGDSITTA